MSSSGVGQLLVSQNTLQQLAGMGSPGEDLDLQVAFRFHEASGASAFSKGVEYLTRGLFNISAGCLVNKNAVRVVLDDRPLMLHAIAVQRQMSVPIKKVPKFATVKEADSWLEKTQGMELEWQDLAYVARAEYCAARSSIGFMPGQIIMQVF